MGSSGARGWWGTGEGLGLLVGGWHGNPGQPALGTGKRKPPPGLEGPGISSQGSSPFILRWKGRVEEWWREKTGP